jgi:photosystem II stability/assembly factor-like uncharacterized protein
MAANLAPEIETEQLIYQFAAAEGWGRAAKQLCFAAGLGGLLVSRDRGKTWANAYHMLHLGEALPTLAAAVAPGPEQVVFAGYNGGLLHSEDGGETWTNATFSAPAPAFAALCVSPNYAEDGLVWAGTLADGVYYSTDRGEHWKTGSLGLIDMNILCLGVSPNFRRQPMVFAGAQSGLFCSRNAGRSWREVDLPCGYDAVLSLALSPGFEQNGTLLAGTETQGLLRSDDAGQHWRRVGERALSNSISQIGLAPRFPREPHLLVLHDGGLSASEDGGETWHPWRDGPLTHDDTPATAFVAPRGFGPGELVLVGLEGGSILRLRA